MAYSINPNIPKARAIAMKLLVEEGLPLQTVANKCGVHRTTIWRWKCKWDKLNCNVQFVNYNRPSVPVGKKNRLTSCKWSIRTESARPLAHPNAITSDVVRLILETRDRLNRCAEVVWHHVRNILGVVVSLSSVRRILRRHHYFDGARKPRVKRTNPRRPFLTRPGELVQTDTIHHVDQASGRRLYYYTVIDLYSRMAYTMVASRCLPGLAAKAIFKAQDSFGFKFSMVQADNGLEFSRYFEQELGRRGIAVRHSRLGRPNDNAHIERFNRTVQEECIGHYWRTSESLARKQEKLTNYLDFYNNKRIHLGIQMRTPAEMLQRC